MALLIRKIPIYFFAGFVFLSLGFSDPFKDLDINFLLDNTVEKEIKNIVKDLKGHVTTKPH